VANTPQAKKRAKQAEMRRLHNTSLRSKLRTSIKKVLNAIKGGNKADAENAYQQALPQIDAMVNKKIIHKNKAARHKSRLSAHIREIT
jgi:small subunit ribosomal protein S20